MSGLKRNEVRAHKFAVDDAGTAVTNIIDPEACNQIQIHVKCKRKNKIILCIKLTELCDNKMTSLLECDVMLACMCINSSLPPLRSQN